MNFRLILMCAPLVLALFACCKKPPPPEPWSCYSLQNDLFAEMEKDSCYEIPPKLSGASDYIWEYPRYLYGSASLNPTGEDEMIYVKVDLESWPNSHDLWKINLCNGEKTFLAESVHSTPSWHSIGWIIFKRPDLTIWKVKDNGDSLIQVTKESAGHAPSWSPDGKNILFWRGQIGLMSLDLSKNTIDTLGVHTGKLTQLSPDGTKVPVILKHTIPFHLGYYDFIKEEYVDLVEASIHQTDAFWSKDGNYLYWSSIGVFKTNIHTGETIQLKKSCSSQYNWLLDISEDQSRWLIGRSVNEHLGNNRVFGDGFLTITDANGENGMDLVLD